MDNYCEAYKVEISSLEINEKPKVEITLKPKFAIIVMFFLAIAMFFTLDWRWMLFGAFILFFCIAGTFFVSNRKVIDIYEDFVIIYDKKDLAVAYKIYWDDITEWRFNTRSDVADYMLINLINEEYVVLESFNSSKVAKYFMEKIPNKEYNRKRLESLKQAPARKKWGTWIKDLFRTK